jgi:UDP-N-acetylglucosamine--N-acetylmuramyl-(pentapeptide) pyrophosphoryl-undecaprenol N-acetylglucosamine transferase
VYPGLSVAAALQREPDATLDPSASLRTRFLYLGRAEGIERNLAQRVQIPFRAIDVGAIRGMGVLRVASNLARLLRAISQCRAIIRDFQPNAIFATGGYVSAPLIWAGALEHIPSVLYLPDLEPGWAIRATARWATRIAVSFEEVAQRNFFAREKTIVTGYPVREQFTRANRADARRKFQLDPAAHILTVFGGSRGAHHINEVVSNHMSALTKIAQLILITGKDDQAWMNDLVKELQLESRVRVFGFLDEGFADALAAADVVISRAGAATLGEFPALGLPAILVPYPYAGKHQKQNAHFLTDHGAAVEIDNFNLERELVPTVKRLFAEPEKLSQMQVAARALAVPNAAENLAAVLKEIAVPSPIGRG